MHFMRFFILLGLFGILACQEENTIESPESGAFTVGSPLGVAIVQTAQADTSGDNIIDSTSCYRIEFPYLITVNGQPVNVNSVDSYQTVAAILSSTSMDDDTITFNFPITLKFRDHSTQTVSSSAELAGVNNVCGPEALSFNCIGFVFPISFTVYDTAAQTPDAVTVSDEESLYEYVTGLSPETLLSFVFPVSLLSYDGELITVDNHSAMLSVLNGFSGDCSEDPAQQALGDILTDGAWGVSYFYDGSNQTLQYSSYSFSFNDSGQILVQTLGGLIYGTWSLYEENGELMLSLDFQDGTLSALEDEWRVEAFLPDEFRLRQQGGGSDPDQLHFVKF